MPLPTIVLASASPRRKQLLEMLGFPVLVHPHAVPEVPLPRETPLEYSRRLAREKAQGVPGRLVLAADTIVVQDGEILVAPITAPSWAPVFAKIKATVTDIGGVMSHAAIVCREYGIPAVTGTAYGTREIKTGDMIRVDGTGGKVTKI